MNGPFKVVVLSAVSRNLRYCVSSLMRNEPGLGPDRILIVDDGARAGWPDAPVTWIPGKSPFVFSRNANIGIRAAGGDVVLMNDDAALETPGGFTALAAFMSSAKGIGLCSAAIDGVVGNCNQRPLKSGGFRAEGSPIAFVCVYIPWSVYRSVGALDERFVGYGKDDRDYCERVFSRGLALGIFDPCVVKHGVMPSTFRTRPDIADLCRINTRLYQEKRKDR